LWILYGISFQTFFKKVGASAMAAPDLDGGGLGAQAWWEAPCADTESLVRG